LSVRNAKFKSCFLAPGDRLDEANLRHLTPVFKLNKAFNSCF